MRDKQLMTPQEIIGRMNTAYNGIYGTMSGETRRNAERVFYECKDMLEERKIHFYQTIDGRWVLGERKTGKWHSRARDG